MYLTNFLCTSHIHYNASNKSREKSFPGKLTKSIRATLNDVQNCKKISGKRFRSFESSPFLLFTSVNEEPGLTDEARFSQDPVSLTALRTT